MAADKRYKKGRHGRDSGQFAAIPYQVLNSAAYIGLGAYAVKLLFDMFVQFRGNNNGDLCAAFSVMSKRGWKSKETLHNAKHELIESGILFETRKGGRPNKASLYAVTWLPMDDCGGKLDVRPQEFPRGLYRHGDAVLPIAKESKNEVLSTVAVPKQA